MIGRPGEPAGPAGQAQRNHDIISAPRDVAPQNNL